MSRIKVEVERKKFKLKSRYVGHLSKSKNQYGEFLLEIEDLKINLISRIKFDFDLIFCQNEFLIIVY